MLAPPLGLREVGHPPLADGSEGLKAQALTASTPKQVYTHIFQ